MFETLKKIFNKVMPDLNVDDVALESRLVEDLHFDSLAIMMLAMAIEDEFKITFDEPMNFVTVKDVVDFLETLKK